MYSLGIGKCLGYNGWTKKKQQISNEKEISLKQYIIHEYKKRFWLSKLSSRLQDVLLVCNLFFAVIAGCSRFLNFVVGL